MNSRAFLVVGALLVSPAWSQEPAPQAAVLTPQSFDRNSESIKKIVRDAAATQSAPVQLTEEKPAKRDPATVIYVPPEKPAPVSEPPRRLPDASPRSDGFLSAVFETILDEVLDIEADDDITSSNEMLRCRVQKEQKTAPPGIDNCPSVD